MNPWKKSEFSHLFEHRPVPDETMDRSMPSFEPEISEEEARQLESDAAFVAAIKLGLKGSRG